MKALKIAWLLGLVVLLAVVACAKEGAADYIVSGDTDLLILVDYEGTRVVSPAAFAGILATTSADTA